MPTTYCYSEETGSGEGALSESSEEQFEVIESNGAEEFEKGQDDDEQEVALSNGYSIGIPLAPGEAIGNQYNRY